eukprot:CAMPEP_0184688534 /NCGR_PEP_ID=MMETSP0312-20130426/30150_1 /TAXON_ID=31354 /ORGANISM="Compsopogon coeruleus, Strain SAG 36.94" /LENGTH=44 /DNA_ID= /DNA_START= /DNA_END= /DNA_ORIENTATION=
MKSQGWLEPISVSYVEVSGAARPVFAVIDGCRWTLSSMADDGLH